MRSILLAATLLFSMHTLQASEYPNMVGTWQQIKIESANGGTLENPLPLNFIHEVAKTPTVIIIDRNEGPLFSGKRVSGFGATELAKVGGTHLLVAAFKPDGKSFIMSEDTNFGIGDWYGETMTICSATILTTQNSAACITYKKIK